MRTGLLANFLFVITVAISACFEPPMPEFRVYNESGTLNQSENKIKGLVNETATRQRVVGILGAPIAYQKNYVSYIACGRQGGVDFFLGTADGVGDVGWVGGPQYDYNELVITFDNQDRVSGYKRNLVADIAHSISEQQRTQNLREFADQGDRLAQMLLEQTVFYRAEHEDGAAQ